MSTWQNIFNESCQTLFPLLSEDEQLNINLTSEQTDFIRFNQTKVRQASSVEQGSLSLELKWNNKTANFSIELSLSSRENKIRLEKALKNLQAEIKELPDDPFFTPIEKGEQSQSIVSGRLPDSETFVTFVSNFGNGLDLAGYYAGGITCRGNANSLGQQHWFESTSFFFDYSLYSAKEKAVKGSYAGNDFKDEELKRLIDESAQALKVMDQKQVELSPGKYRCYLAPAALNEIAGMLGWHGLSAGAYKRGECPLGELYEGKESFSEKVSWKENFQLGLNPRFNEWGEVSAETLPLITNGKMNDLLISKETEKEYGLKSNQASGSEAPRSFEMETGNLSNEDILKKLGTGLYLSNLHYLNWSDKQKGRVTGMTRFGCLWVENGKVIGPIKDLRFDETLYHIFGKGLLEVTDFSQVEMETGTYNNRSLGGSKLPGILVEDFTFTL